MNKDLLPHWLEVFPLASRRTHRSQYFSISPTHLSRIAMLADQTIAKVLEHGLRQGADFAEVFIEDSVSRSLDLLDRKIDQINSGNSYGIGIRLLFGHESCYGYSSDPDPAGLL
ncbi:MAG: DNA gyrase modulator, partial [SAR324 cluster bacterium]|nr:DNA gyrase modulator [SAR324 cluster bacterium]